VRKSLLAVLVLAGLLALGAIQALPSQANACYATSMSVRFEPGQTRYPRGTYITLAARLTGPWGGVPGRWVRLEEQSTRGTVNLGWYCTDGNGFARRGYQVPTDPNKDNVCIIAYFGGDGTYYASDNRPGVRIPIGTW